MVGEYCLVHPKIIEYFLIDDGNESINTGMDSELTSLFFSASVFYFLFFFYCSSTTLCSFFSLLDLKIDIDNKQLLDLMAGWKGGSADCCRIVCTHTYVRVELQDGTITEWLPATALIAR